MRKDQLAAGARSAKFAGGIGENDIFKNAAPETETPEQPTPAPTTSPVRSKKVFRPLGKTIRVRRAEYDEVNPHSILLTDETKKQDQPAEGVVLEFGNEVTTVKVGERVTFGKYSGAEFKMNGEVTLLMSVDDILGIIEDTPTTGNQYLPKTSDLIVTQTTIFDPSKIPSVIGRA